MKFQLQKHDILKNEKEKKKKKKKKKMEWKEKLHYY